MSGTALRVVLPPEKRERLVLILHPRRIAFIIHYVVGAVFIFVGFLYYVTAAGGWTAENMVSWTLGLISIGIGSLIMVRVELKRRYTLYIVTSWNVRTRTGIVRRSTVRVFYDEIDFMETTSTPEEQIAEMGDLRIFSKKRPDAPAIVWSNLWNPEGIREVIQRFVDTTPDPPPWSHIPR